LPEGVDEEPEQTVSIQRVLQRAIFHMHSSGKSQISSGDVLAAMFREQDSHAIFLLESQGVTRLDVINYLSHGIEKSGSSDGEDGETGDLSVSKSEPGSDGDSEDEEGGESDKKKSLLERYTVNLVAEAKAGRIDPLIGRESELTRTMQVLCRRRKNNPLYVGDAGVGKTALAEGLAWKIARGEVPEVLQESVVYSLDIGGHRRWHQVPGRVRAAHEGHPHRAAQDQKGDPLYRRDPHHRRSGRSLGRGDGCGEPAEAGAGVG
jgi:ATP-dependent Clp protease ATP-binding subunit ClpA